MTEADGITEREAYRVESGHTTRLDDQVAVEEPLEIRAAGETISVTMRTPGHDDELAVGFLFAEGILAGPTAISRVYHCGRPGTDGFGNTIEVIPSAGTVFEHQRAEAGRRGTLMTASCGVCGRRSIDDLQARCGRIEDPRAVEAETLLAAFDGLRTVQPVFNATGGVHAAAACDADGEIRVIREDIGRHNAVDKVIGAWILERASTRGATPAPLVLIVSGRASFEIVQKAAMARIAVVATVSAASSMAVDLAHRCGITLAAFCRTSSLNIYTHPERILTHD